MPMPKPRRWYRVPIDVFVLALDEQNARGMTGFVTRDSAGGRLRFRFGAVEPIADPTCPICEGSGINIEDPLKDCEDCGGEGVRLP